jgi:N-acetylglucosaminyl-diphospho-decaprenol L-rhamnosyltransferase
VQTIAVAIVNWNTRELLRTCLRGVLAEEPAKVVVADNGSQDGSVEMVRQDFPSVTLIVSPENPGYGAASNRAISHCEAEYVLLLNSDTELRPGALRTLRGYLEGHERVGVVGPRLLNPDGTLQESCFPFPRPLLPLMKRRSGGFSHDRPGPVPWVVGAALAIRRTAFQSVGGFDESYHMYFEEVDLCYRLRKAGWETHFVPDAGVVHVIGASTQQRRAETLLRTRLSSLEFFRRHHRGIPLAVGLTMEYGITLGRLLRDSARYCFARSAGRRDRLKEDLAVWWTLLRRPSAGIRS